MDERAALAGDGFLNDGVRVAKRIDANATQQVEKAVTLLVDDVHALSPDKEDGIAVIG